MSSELTLSNDGQDLPRISAPESWEGSTLQIIDFTDNNPVRIITTALKRLWLIQPTDVDTKASNKSSNLEQEFQFALQANSNYITGAAPGRAWDDALWRRRTRYKLLKSPANTQGELNEALIASWRKLITKTYVHVFWDLYQSLKLSASHIGHFRPEDSNAVALWNLELPADHTIVSLKIKFDTDTFIYPVWIDTGVSVEISTGEQRSAWSAKEGHWTQGVWIRYGIETTVTYNIPKEISSDDCRLVAVLVKGACEQRAVPKPWAWKEGEDEIDPDRPEFATEAVYLARAVWLSAGDTTTDCNFDGIYTRVEPEVPRQSRFAPSVSSSLCNTLYQPLVNGNSIRLLKVEPGKGKSELQTSLLVVDLGDKPEYEALSYTWGDPKDKVSLSCAPGKVSIPSNLQEALYQLRYSERPRYIWADAVCINQEDIQERGQQVSIMRNIFQGASRVLVWLGTDSSKHAVIAFKAICCIVRSWTPPGDKFLFTSYHDAFKPLDSGARQYLHKAIDINAWSALKALFSTNYFRRFWIVQELSLSQSAVVFWGEHHIAWPLVGVCATWLLSKGWDFHIGEPLTAAYNAFLIYALPFAKHSAITHFSKLDLSVMLGITVGIFDSTDPRDRIYAVLGLPFSGNDPERAPLLRPDYNESVRSVYTKAAKRMLQQDQHLRVLSSVQHGAEIDTSWPSWVPKWNESYHAEPLALREEQGYYANAGELFVPDDNTFSPDGESIFLTGLKCSTITEVGEVMNKYGPGPNLMARDKYSKALLSILGTFSNENNRFRSSWSSKLEEYTIFGYSNPAKQEEAIKSGIKGAAATGIPGKYGMRSSVETLTGDKAQVDHLGEFLVYWRERSSWKPDELLHGSVGGIWNTDRYSVFQKEIMLCSLNTFWGRRVFHCGDGRFGLGPAAAQPGDVIVVLFGGIIPFVLRPLGDDRWRFVGECFVPSIMQGEAVEAAGLLEPGSFRRDDDGALTLELEEKEEAGPRHQRKYGECNVLRFEIR